MKQFEPTQSRLERARREGDHPLSRDAVAVAAFTGSLLALWTAAMLTADATRYGLRAALEGGGSAHLAFVLAIPSAAAALCGAGAAVLATLVQTRAASFCMPALRLAFGRTFSRDAWASTARCALVAGAGAAGIALTIAPHPQAIAKTLAAVTIAGGAGALADVLATRAAWRRRLRMTHEELRRDLREHDGDPQTRGRRRRLHRALMRGAVREVRRASFVIVNPTHVAVALRYAPPQTPVPEILVRAADAKARKVRSLAGELSIPVIEDPPLARSLFAHDALGPIPPEAYVAVAQIVASLQRQR
jgi:flagellar biosynthesis protein FlhB